MQSVEKDGMKLYDKLAATHGVESQRLQVQMEDLGTHGASIGLYSPFLRH